MFVHIGHAFHCILHDITSQQETLLFEFHQTLKHTRITYKGVLFVKKQTRASGTNPNTVSLRIWRSDSHTPTVARLVV